VGWFDQRARAATNASAPRTVDTPRTEAPLFEVALEESVRRKVVLEGERGTYEVVGEDAEDEPAPDALGVYPGNVTLTP
jgi:hypothetical protein